MEEETELQLSRLSLSESAGSGSLAEETDDDCDSLTGSGEAEITDELPESVLSYLQIVKQRSEDAEKLILEDLETTDVWLSNSLPDNSNHFIDIESDYLTELAFEYSEEPEALKKRVLADLEEDDRRTLSSCDITEKDNADVKTEENAVPADILGSDKDISFCYIEVEKSCRQKLQQWEKEHRRHNEMERASLSTQRAILEKEIKEQDEKQEDWRKTFEKEHLVLNTLQKEKQEKLESELKKNSESWEEELKNHQNLINKMETDLIKERNTFEEQMATAKKHLEELQCKSAVKIQAAFRGHQILKKYSPILKQKREDRKSKEELKQKMDIERKKLEDKIKFKLEEKTRREEEKKRNEEIVRKRMEESKRQEYLEQQMRQREYEKKKNEEKLRLEKAKIVKEESRNKIEIDITNTSKTKSPAEVIAQKVEHDHLPLKIAKKEQKELGKSEMQQQEIKDKRKESNDNYLACADHSSSVQNLELNETQKNLVNENKSIILGEQSLKEIVDTGEHIPNTQSVLSYIEEHGMQSLSQPEPEPQLCSISEIEHANPNVEEISANTQNETPIVSMTRSLFLLDHIEEKRLAWMKSFKPWARVLRDSNKKNVVRQTRQRRRSSAKKLPPLKESLIFQNNPWHDMQQVTTLTLSDLSGCSLSTLSQCVNLKYLSLTRCRLTALDGLSSCKELQYIDVQENCINVINCEDLENLTVLLLSKNQITAIHGLDNCTNLMNLELSFNLITRIGGIEPLLNLQRLVLDHNQLISTKGLEATPMLTYLDCSYNYLTELEGIQNCGLMQFLKLQGNNLSEIPKLDNHVLLREIYLDDNNINTSKVMSSYWLPLLQVFSVSQNSLVHLAQFNTFVSLEDLDISNNCLSDLQSITPCMEGCASIHRLSLGKNPFLQESNWRCTLLKILPTLNFLNDEEIAHEDYTRHQPVSGSFLALCQSQIFNIHRLWRTLNCQQSALSSLETLEMYCNTLKEILKLSQEHRYAHEYGDTDAADRDDPETLRKHTSQPDSAMRQHNSAIINGGHEERQITLQQVHPLPEDSFLNSEQDQVKNTRSLNTQSQQTETAKTEKCSSNSRKTLICSQPVENRELSAAIVIQSQWRGYVVRRDISYYAKLHDAAFVIQSAWRYYCCRKKSLQKKHCAKTESSEIRKYSATVIQAAWKGFFLRKKLAAAFAAIEREELEDDFEEVNLDEFIFDENVLEKSWSLDSTNSHYGATHLSSKPEQAKKSGISEGRDQSLPWFPQEAWSASKAHTVDSGHKAKRENLNSRSEKQNLSHVSSMKSNIDVSFKSEKEEKISQEWGFKDASTAQMMLKRAQKMKSKQAKKSKMLDPAVRLALFKNNENKHPPAKPPKTVQPTKIEYFRGAEEDVCQLNDITSESLARSREMTYQWLHTQCGDVGTTRSTGPKCKRLLPELNHEVLNGGRVQLVGAVSKEDDDLELLSVKSGSTLSQNREKKLETQMNSAASSHRNVFSPVKINSGPQRKERISFRDNPVQLSGGWGGGKKKGKQLPKF
ncbi:leucine-rich repeat and IQ domain-containing protein 1 [Pseudophryne corroboree]|uniref:leucine-rich repeat and IQ domain-containing protein 1 n=1 Tax=Pseudophryne corroboree TaxID=495146 RepID=UPI00308159DA